jgi:membrane protease YdiL (CAAX protease family)
LFFRGVLLSWLKDSFRNKHLAVWLSAIVFSAIHIQFFGFFPRMLLGAYLGYLFLWTGSLWTSVLAHFLNNAIVVITAFLFNIGYIATNYDMENSGENGWLVALSFGVTVVLIGYLARVTRTQERNA